MLQNDVFRGCGIRVDILEKENFLKIKETLTRIGVSKNNEKILFQSCHILHKKDGDESVYSIVHFKEMFILDGKNSTLSADDINRRNLIINLLKGWGLLNPLVEIETDNSISTTFKVISHKEKPEWKLVQKYTIGQNKYGVKNNEIDNR